MADPEKSISTVFLSGTDGYHTYRIPAIVCANDGTLLAFCEGRKRSSSDAGDIDIVLKRSTDHGATWGELLLVQEEGGDASITIGNPVPIVDKTTGFIHLLFTRENDTVFHTVSTDNGNTWSPRSEITSSVKLDEWGWYATGPCHGVQLTRGEQAGRLVAPANHRIGGNGSDSGSFGAQIIYSDDHGATWKMDAYVEESNGTAPNETTLVELNTLGSPLGGGSYGSHLYINSRDYGSDPGARSEAYSGDGGSSYSVGYDGNAHFVTPICQGSLVRFSAVDAGDLENRIIFSAPNGGSRRNGSLWVSNDETQTWSEPKLLLEGAYAYSDMVKTDDGQLGVFAETDGYGAIKFIKVNEEWIDQEPPPAENPSGAFWNFEEKAVGSFTDTGSGSVVDISVAGEQHNLTADLELEYIVGAPAYTPSRALAFVGEGGLRLADGLSRNHYDYGANDSFTVEVAFRVSEGEEQTGALVAKDLGSNQPSWWLRIENGGHLRFLVADHSSEAIASTGDVTFNDGEWHSVAAVKDATARRLRLYVDGILLADVADTTTGSHANSQSLCIGRFNGSNRHFTGAIDFVRITAS
ncbi:exo-alpha-sialidase [Rubritalea tangerina]|uniref:exo-alpha-sialidase n=2 Tax=Rubritalea tangerina TaxID=430798 RepID=A0ABW4ZCP6_9BACT